MAETYSKVVKCDNCDFGDGYWKSGEKIEIPKGKRVEEIPCPKCGCFTLESF